MMDQSPGTNTRVRPRPTRIYVPILLLLLAVAFPVAVGAQDANAPTPLYIELTRHEPEPDGSAAFLDAVAERLAAEGFDPIFIEADELDNYPYFWEQTALHLILSPVGDRLGVGVTPYTGLMLEPSAALDAAFDVTNNVLIEPDDPASRRTALDLVTAFTLYADANCADALPLFHALADVEPGDSRFTDYQPVALDFYIATCALVAGDLDAAATAYRSISDAMAETDIGYSIPASTNLAWIYLQRDRNADAFEVMNHLVESVEEADSGDDFWLTEALMRQSRMYALAYQYDEAIAAIDRAIAIADADPQGFPAAYRAELYTERGLRILLLYEWDRVLEQYDQAIRIDPTYATAYFNRGVLYYTQGPRERALEDFQTYLELNPDGPFASEAREYMADIPVEIEALNAPLATREAMPDATAEATDMP